MPRTRSETRAAIAAAGDESSPAEMKPLRTARSILASFHGTTCPERRISWGETTPERKDVDTARPQLLASEASLHDRRVQSAPAPTRDSLSLCSYERTTGQAARPPPFQA